MNKVIIGKYTLESLTNGMYSNPQDLFREYIQNSVDSIDEAIRDGIIIKSQAEIQININKNQKSIDVSDNGKGISTHNAEKYLLDIGNSRKDMSQSRGFRGIGRLSGLGYCDKLIFSTSFKGEGLRTKIVFDAALLKKLLYKGSSDNETIESVIEQITSVKNEPEKKEKHYFKVEMLGVKQYECLFDNNWVTSYLVQNAPIDFSSSFKWGEIIKKRLSIEGIIIPEYNVTLSFDAKESIQLKKAYGDSVLADRVKKIEDSIKDICIKDFYINEKLSAILWYAQTGFLGTVLNNDIKGIRFRKGNILIGDQSVISRLFKEERFNGWLIGEIYIIGDEIIPNSRRDDFEQNESYLELMQQLKDWTFFVSKEIRKLSYERSLSVEKTSIIVNNEIEDINNLFIEDDFQNDSESALMEREESFDIAQSDFLDKLSTLLNQKKVQTRYKALDINLKLSIEQRKVLERVFDLISNEYGNVVANSFITTIARKF